MNASADRIHTLVRMSHGSIAFCQTAFRKRHHNGEGVGTDVFAYRRCRTTPPALFSFLSESDRRSPWIRNLCFSRVAGHLNTMSTGHKFFTIN